MVLGIRRSALHGRFQHQATEIFKKKLQPPPPLFGGCDRCVPTVECHGRSVPISSVGTIIVYYMLNVNCVLSDHNRPSLSLTFFLLFDLYYMYSRRRSLTHSAPSIATVSSIRHHPRDRRQPRSLQLQSWPPSSRRTPTSERRAWL